MTSADNFAAVWREAKELGIPVSAKAILIVDGRVLLARNHRDEWELPGGRPDTDEMLEVAVVREVLEETGLRVEISQFVDWWDYPIAEERVTVRVISFVARMDGGGSAEPSIEHTELGWHALDTVDTLVTPDGYKHSIAAAAKTSR